MHAKETEVTHFPKEIPWENAILPPLRDIWCHLIGDELGHCVSNKTFLAAEEFVHL